MHRLSWSQRSRGSPVHGEVSPRGAGVGADCLARPHSKAGRGPSGLCPLSVSAWVPAEGCGEGAASVSPCVCVKVLVGVWARRKDHGDDNDFLSGPGLRGPQATYLTACSARPTGSQLRLSRPLPHGHASTRPAALLPRGLCTGCLGAVPVAPTPSLSSQKTPECHVEPPPPPAAAPCLATGPLHLSLAVSHLPPRRPGMPAVCPAAFLLLQQFRPVSGPSECLWSDGRNSPRALDRVDKAG